MVTGATSGMGKDFVFALAEKNNVEEIWIVGRRQDRLEEIQGRLELPCRIFAADLACPDSINLIRSELELSNAKIDMLINCAGFGIIGSFDESDPEQQAGMIDVNCRALVLLTRAALPYMSNGSNIINLASSAAFVPQPYFAVYAATKAFVLSFSRALSAELKHVSVTAVCPGPVKTEFFDIAERTGKIQIYKKLFMADSKTTVKKSLKAAYNGRRVYTPSFSMKLFRFICKLLPHSLIIKFIK